MKKFLRVIIIVTVIMMIIGITNNSNALSFNANLSSNDKLVVGQEVKVILSLSNIDMDDGIRSIQIEKITVGEEFEEISSTSFSSNTWMPTYLNGSLILMSGTPVKNDGTSITLTLKVKQNITAKSSTVKFENIVASSGSNTGDISIGTKTITIKANEIVENGNQNQTGTTDSGVTDNIQSGMNQTKPNNTDANIKKTISSNKAPSKFPNAGSTDNIIIILLMLVVILVGVISFTKYKRLK